MFAKIMIIPRKKCKSQVRYHVLAIPATLEAEAGESSIQGCPCQYSQIYQKKEEGPEAMAQELRIPVTLLEDPDSFPAPIWYLTTL